MGGGAGTGGGTSSSGGGSSAMGGGTASSGGGTAATGGGSGATGGGTSSTGGGTGTYPATHAPYPTEINYGGGVLGNPVFVSISFSNDDATLIAGADDFFATVGSTAYWTATTSEYGVNAGVAAAPIHLNEMMSGTIQDSDIISFLAGHLASGAFGTPDVNAIYAIIYPASVNINVQGLGMSCDAFGGYHDSIVFDGGTFVYAVLPRCPGFIPDAGDLDCLTGAASHELIEAVTDPDINNPAWAQTDEQHEVWNMLLYGEVGDICVYDSDAFYFPTGFPHMVQRTWSNAEAAAGRYPCVPTLMPYFGATPEQNDTVTYNWAMYSQAGNTNGIKIPVGQTGTLNVDLFSSGPTQAIQVNVQGYPNANTLNITPSVLSGHNGDVLHFSVQHQSDDSAYGGAPFIVTAWIGDRYHYYLGWVGD
jgi:hypothetical protein